MQLHWTGTHHPARDKQLSSPDLSTCRSTTASLPATLLRPSTRRVTAQATWGQRICCTFRLAENRPVLQRPCSWEWSTALHSSYTVGLCKAILFFIQTQLKHSSSMGPHKPTRQGPCASFWPAQDPRTEEATAEWTQTALKYKTSEQLAPGARNDSKHSINK